MRRIWGALGGLLVVFAVGSIALGVISFTKVRGAGPGDTRQLSVGLMCVLLTLVCGLMGWACIATARRRPGQLAEARHADVDERVDERDDDRAFDDDNDGSYDDDEADTDDDERLLDEVEVLVRRGDHAVRVVHLSSGIEVECATEASPMANRTVALSLLRERLRDLDLQA
jgi:hypothetical protein